MMRLLLVESMYRPFDCAIWRVPQNVGDGDILHNHRLRNFDFLRRHNCVAFRANFTAFQIPGLAPWAFLHRPFGAGIFYLAVFHA